MTLAVRRTLPPEYPLPCPVCLISFLILCLALHDARAVVPQSDVMASFNAACRAYEKGDYEHALQMNMRIIQNGFISAALLYNIGNCYFRVGDLPRAILYYRRAWYLAPSDVDITANLTFALRALGLEPLRSNRAFGLLRYLSLPHWAMVLVAAYWIICFLLSAMLWNPRLRRIGRKLVLAVALLALLASLGLGSWLPLLLDPEAVVAAPNTKVLFAPVAGSTLHFYLPQGSFVRIRRARDGWLEVEEGPGRRGWVPEASLRRIIPRRTHQWKR